MRDIYAHRTDGVDRIRRGIPCYDGQLGAIAAYAGRVQVLDYVSRPEVYSALHDRLLRGYALDSLDGDEETPGDRDSASRFARLACESIPAQRAPSVGLGEAARFETDTVAGSGLVLDDELIQLTAFPETNGNSGGRVARPSRRRRL